MSTYYEYQDVKVMIAHKLMSMEGWKVYGYHADHSDSMTDYYDPARWNGVAEKNGYILCVDVYGAAQPEEIRKYNYDSDSFTYDHSIVEKIAKLEQMTVERGASEAEEATAKAAIKKLREKAQTAAENNNKYVVVGMIPGHMANPPRMNWHIEKDGIYIAKGNGILKYAHVDSYYRYPHYEEDMKKFKTMNREDYKKELIQEFMWKWSHETEEQATKSAESHIKNMEEDEKLVDQFEAFINKINALCGGMIGEGDGVVYEKVTVTEYKKENKAVEDTTGSIKDGQCFVLKVNFNYGCYKGLVYRIHESEYNGKKSYRAYKLNGKLTKECTGNASRNNSWYIGTADDENFLGWIKKGSISWCHIEEVKIPYEVEKVVKKAVKADHKNNNTMEGEQAATQETDINTYTYEVSEDTDTRDGSKIYLVKVAEKLSREEYIQVNQYIKSLGGYYSKFKHAFLFKDDPTEKLNAITQEAIPTEESTTEAATETTKEAEKESINYTITEDTHTKTGEKIWIAKPETELSKTDFAEVKRKFATMQGYYSTFKHGFIFKYDPSEILKTG